MECNARLVNYLTNIAFMIHLKNHCSSNKYIESIYSSSFQKFQGVDGAYSYATAYQQSTKQSTGNSIIRTVLDTEYSAVQFREKPAPQADSDSD